MPRLDCYQNRQRSFTVQLKSDSILVGRAIDCDLQLADDAVSRHHVRILLGGAGDHVIEDLSSNGTRVNASTIDRRALLVPGDRIYLGDWILIYQPDEAPAEDLAADGEWNAPTLQLRRPPKKGEE